MGNLKKINLLQSKLSKEKLSSSSIKFNIQLLPVVLFSLSGVFFLISLGFRMHIYLQEKGLQDIITQQQKINEIVEKTKLEKKEQAKMVDDIVLLKGCLKRGVVWSDKLMQLRGLIPDRVWLTQFSFQKESDKDSGAGKLSLKGGLLPEENKNPLETLSQFVNNLKSDAAFFSDFSNLVLVDSRTELKDQDEIMTFAIEMPLGR